MNSTTFIRKNWKKDLLHGLRAACSNTPFTDLLLETEGMRPLRGLHLGVFLEPYLSYVLAGKKTVESRFSMNRNAPFEQVVPGDLLVIKKSSGPVCGICEISNAWFYRIDSESWEEIERYAGALCMDASPFWEQKRKASYATLMQIDSVMRIPEIRVDKADPRSWVVVQPSAPPRQGVLI